MSSPRVVLLGLTGMGNAVLRGLGSSVAAVFTDTYEGPFPYYPEIQLNQEARALGVPVHENVNLRRPEGVELLRSYSPDLLVVATFRQILTAEVLSVARLASVNFHPSLLPRYRGPDPTRCVLLAGERETGLTVCHIAVEVDAGPVLLQRRLAIDPGDCDGDLRRKLAGLARETAPRVLELFRDWSPEGTAQAPGNGSYHRRPDFELACLERAPNAVALRARFRAFTPFPGATVEVNGIKRRVVAIHDDPRSGRIEFHGCQLEVEEYATGVTSEGST